MRVLVVSQSGAERERAVAAMRVAEAFEVVEAASAVEAHRAMSEDHFDVVVMDGDMRPEGGYSVLYEMRAAAEIAGTTAPPSVVLMDREQDRWLAKWAGAEVALLKPVDSFALAKRVEELVVG
ncbi:MAG: response regulator [Nitriliruptorales bacterium]